VGYYTYDSFFGRLLNKKLRFGIILEIGFSNSEGGYCRLLANRMSTRDGLNDTRRSRRERDIKQEDVDGKDGVGIKQPKGERQRSVHFEGDIPLVVIEI